MNFNHTNKNVIMKKYLIFLLLIMVSSVVMAQEKKLKWDYPIKPGMEEWRQFKSVEDMYNACQIPDKVLQRMSTEELVDICLNFPSPPLFPLFNTPQEGFMSHYSSFNGIRELLNRKDAGHYLFKKYAAISLSDFNPLWPLYRQGQFVSHYKFIEAILSQPQIIQSLEVKEQKLLLKEAMLKFDEKISNSDLFSGYGLEMNLWVIVRILYSENKSLIQGKLQSDNIQEFLNSGVLVDMDMNLIYKQAKKIINENAN
jgi:hypothetical protein